MALSILVLVFCDGGQLQDDVLLGLFQFVIESVVICILGGVIGIATGSTVSLALAKFAGWTTLVSWYSVVLAFTFSVLIGLVFGIWPARKASLLNPIEALRYE